MNKVKLTAGEDLIFQAMVREPAMRIQEDSLAGDGLRYGLIRCDSPRPVLAKLLDNEDVFGLLALDLLKVWQGESMVFGFTYTIYELSELAKTLVEL